MISPAFARHLRDMRASCNRQFHEARLQFPHLDARRFTHFLEQYADGLVNSIEARQPTIARHVAATAYEHGLQLTGLNWVPVAGDHNGGLAGLATAWQRHVATFVLAYPGQAREIMIMLAHALHQFAQHPGSRPDQWLQRMQELVPACTSFTQWKQAGQILAWQAGLAHFRESALALADRLPEALALICVRAAQDNTWHEQKLRFQQHPWWTPDTPASTSLQERWRIGNFAAFGGSFDAPPRVTLHDGQWFVESAGATWLLYADAYGATLHKTGIDEAKAITFKNPSGKTVGISGQHIIHNHSMHTVHDIDSITSWAHDDNTLAVCSNDTFAVIVFSLGGSL